MTTAIVATAFGGPEVLVVTHPELPPPGPGEVSVRVRAAGTNPIDHKRFSGLMGADPARLPMRVGTEVSGEVTAVGADAVGPAGAVAVGDAVIAWPVSGGYADEVVVPASSVVPKPAGMSFEAAAGLLLTGTTAVHALTAAGVTAGTTVLVHGVSGGVGILAAQVARADGARVVGTASERHHEALRRYGVVPLTYGPGLAERVRGVAAGGVDAVVDAVGTDEAIDASLELVADRRRIVSAAAFGRAGDGITLIGGGPGADPGTEVRAAARLRLTAMVEAGTLEVVVARTFPLAEAAAALELLAGQHAGGKVVLVP